jgi:hypothetical protein
MAVLSRQVTQERQKNQFYRKYLSDIAGITFQTKLSPDFYSNYCLTTVIVDPEKIGGVMREDI